MEVCWKLDNIKLENRPYTEVSVFNNTGDKIAQCDTTIVETASLFCANCTVREHIFGLARPKHRPDRVGFTSAFARSEPRCHITY